MAGLLVVQSPQQLDATAAAEDAARIAAQTQQEPVLTGLAGHFIPTSVLNVQQTEQLAWVLIGVSLMLLVIFRPQGLLGDRKELAFNA